MPSFAYIQRQTWVSMLLFETHDILNMYTHVNIDVSTLYEGEVCLANWLGPSLARIDYYAHCPGASMAWRGQQKRELKFRMYREHRQHKLLLRKLGRIHNWQTIATDSLGEKDRTWNKEKKKKKKENSVGHERWTAEDVVIYLWLGVVAHKRFDWPTIHTRLQSITSITNR